MQKATAELDELFRQSRSDPAVLRQVLDELQFRDKPKARKLYERVRTALSRDLEGEGPGKQPSVHTEPNSKQDTTVIPSAFGIPAIAPDQAQLMAALRATFTPRGELLARWGMTDLMPQEMIETVFAVWKTRLGSVGTAGGGHVNDLERDMTHLKHLPRATKQFRECKH